MEPGSDGFDDAVSDCADLENEGRDGDAQERPPEDCIVVVWDEIAYPAESVLHAAN